MDAFKHSPRGWRKVAGILATLTLSSATLVACGSAGPKDSYELHYTTYSNSTSDQSKTVQRWAEDVERLTDGKVTVTLHYSESLLGGDESALGTTDGRADMSQVGSIYAMSDLPLYSISELPFETDNPEVHMRSLQRLYEENTDYRDSFESRGLRQLFPLPIGPAMIGLNSPAESPQDLRNRNLRASGLSAQLMLEQGANPVALGAGEIYESLSRGVVQGYIISLPNLPTFGLTGNTPYLVDPGIGQWASSIVVINEELYESMPQEFKDAIQEASENSIEYGLEELSAIGDQACRELVDNGTQFTAFSDSDVEKWKNESPATDNWVSTNEQKGFPAQDILDDYRAINEEEEGKSSYVSPLEQCIKENQ